MEFYQLKYFVKVAETEHMTRAAEELNLSEDSSAEGYMTRNGSVYTFFFSVEGSGAGNCTITVKFTADKLTLPEVEESTNGNEGTVVPSPMPDAKN